MLFVVPAQPGVLEISYMWLPTWIGMNTAVMKDIEEHVTRAFVGKEAKEEEVHEEVLNYICTRFKELTGLREYLSAIKYVQGPQG